LQSIVHYLLGGTSLFLYGAFAGAGFFDFVPWRRHDAGAKQEGKSKEHAVGPEKPESQQSRLLFDDYQPDSREYVIKNSDAEPRVVPSSKSARPIVDAGAPVLRETEIVDFFDLDSEATARESEPRAEFHGLVDKTLIVVKNTLFAHTAAFFWKNPDRKQIVLEGVATDSTAFRQSRRFDIGTDLISTVATDGKPQILSEVNPTAETEMLRYYESAAGVRSAVAVPVFFRSGIHEIETVGVLVADSTAEDAFGQETVDLLGRFTKLISALIKSYTDKYDLLLDSELLGSIRRLQDRLKADHSEQAIITAVVEEIGRIVNPDLLTVTMYNDDVSGWTVQKVVNPLGHAAVLPSQHVDIAQSLVGEVIASNRVEVIPDLAGEERPRYHRGEALPKEGAFVCVPISSYNRCYGAVAVESHKTTGFSGQEVELLYRLVENAAAALEVGFINDVVKEYLSVDHLTGLMTTKYFLRRVDEEVQRAEDMGSELAYVVVTVDGMEDHVRRYGREVSDVIFREVASLLKAQLRSYDAVGMVDRQFIGVVLAGMTASNAYLWAEKTRKSIASHVISYGSKNFSITVSMGVCGLGEGMKARELMTNAGQVHAKVAAAAGNGVRVY
jgi:diguanylate cyclase (GGDEF)-like protein